MNRAELTDMENRISDYLRGMHRADPKTLQQVAAFDHWPEMAQRERAERAARFVRLLSDAELAAVASGHIRIAELANRVQAETPKKDT